MENAWIKVAGDENQALEEKLSALKEQRIQEKKYSENDCAVISEMEMSVIKGNLDVDALILERLRHMASLWDVDFRAQNITSHRKFAGPIIVAFKKALFPLIRFVLKDFIRQQRDFNASTIRLVGLLSNKK
jgi:hypothetical protein